MTAIYLCVVGGTIITPNEGWIVYDGTFDRDGIDLRWLFAALGVAITLVVAASAWLTTDLLRRRGISAKWRRLAGFGVVLVTLAVMVTWLAARVHDRAF